MISALIVFFISAIWINLHFQIAKKSHKFLKLKKNNAVFRGDPYLVVFNFFAILSQGLTFSSPIIALTVLGSYIISRYWGILSKTGKLETPFYYKNSNRLSILGITHFFFMIFQGYLVVSFIYFEKYINVYSKSLNFIACFLLIKFALVLNEQANAKYKSISADSLFSRLLLIGVIFKIIQNSL